jgi:hypothetical protein
VHAIRPQSESNVGTVVEDERDAGGLARLEKRPGQAQQIGRLRLLLAQLDQVDTGRGELTDQLRELARSETRGGDEVQPGLIYSSVLWPGPHVQSAMADGPSPS